MFVALHLEEVHGRTRLVLRVVVEDASLFPTAEDKHFLNPSGIYTSAGIQPTADSKWPKPEYWLKRNWKVIPL